MPQDSVHKPQPLNVLRLPAYRRNYHWTKPAMTSWGCTYSIPLVIKLHSIRVPQLRKNQETTEEFAMKKLEKRMATALRVVDSMRFGTVKVPIVQTASANMVYCMSVWVGYWWRFWCLRQQLNSQISPAKILSHISVFMVGLFILSEFLSQNFFPNCVIWRTYASLF